MKELEPVGWQFLDVNGDWSNRGEHYFDTKDVAELLHYKTRDIYVIPDGYVLVKKEPDMLQIEDGLFSLTGKVEIVTDKYTPAEVVRDLYKDMIADAIFPKGSVVDGEV